MFLIAAVVGGFIGVWILQALIDWGILSRVMDDPLKGKILSTVAAYFIAVLLSALNSNSVNGVFICLPGAILVGIIGFFSARKIQARIDALDDTSTFD